MSFLKKHKYFILFAIIGALLVIIILTSFTLRPAIEAPPNDNVPGNNPKPPTNPSVFDPVNPSSDQVINDPVQVSEPQFQIVVPEGWRIKEDRCAAENCSDLRFLQDNYFVQVNTNVLFTGGALPGDSLGGVCPLIYSSPTPINSKLDRIDLTMETACAKQYVPNLAVDNVPILWVGSVVINKLQTEKVDPATTVFAVSPSIFKNKYLFPEENGNYIAIFYGYDPSRVGEPQYGSTVLDPNSPELKSMLQKMDQVVQSFDLR